MTPPDNFAFHARRPSGGEGCVHLLVRTGPAAGRTPLPAAVDEVEALVRGWARERCTMTESPERISAWLRSG